MKPDKAKTIFRVKREKDFTIIPDATLRDRRLSFKARGVLAMILSHSDSWVVTNKWLQSQGTEGREAIKLATDELKKFGYAQFDRTSDGVKFTNVWTFYDAPVQRLPVGRDPVRRLTVGRKAVVHSGKPEEPETIVQETIQQDSGDQVTGIEDEQPELPVAKSRHREPAPQVGCAHKVFVQAWCTEFEAKHGFKYHFSGGKDGMAVKRLLSAGETPEQLMAVARQAWDHPDWFNCKQAATIAGFAGRYNDIRTELKSPPRPRFVRQTNPFGNNRLTEERMRELRRGNL